MKVSYALFWLVIFLTSSACQHDVAIRSNPQGAKIYVNDNYLGKSPAIYQEDIGMRDQVEVRAEKEGYKPQKLTLVKSGWSLPHVLGSIVGCACAGMCCSSALANENDSLGPVGSLIGLSILSTNFFARRSKDNVYLKLRPLENAPPTTLLMKKEEEAGKKHDTMGGAPTEAGDEAPDAKEPKADKKIRALPSGYTY